MDSVFGFVGNGYVIVGADASAARSIVVFKHDHDKIMQLDDRKLLAAGGTQADNEAFCEYIQKNMKLYQLNNDLQLTTHGAANFMRNELAVALRKGPYQTNLLLAGVDEGTNEASLYWMDYLAAMSKVNFGAHGYAAHFILSIFDREFPSPHAAPGNRGSEDPAVAANGTTLLSEEEGIALARKLVHELHTRFLMNQPNFVLKIVDKNGCRVLKL